ncbi:DUF7522 family protein [Haloarcula marina]|uniref:DUF7522 family protein n=1 Tax=Haloarcula marina TaxID=2961574 RepID=UPI0020B77E6A|nr:hypothetical protein [Halomicroarcula marina]
MYDVPFRTDIEAPFADELVDTARTNIGDMLRSVIYFTPSEMDLLYVRTDLYESQQRALEAKARLVEFERVGFTEAPVRTALSVPREPESIGPYEFTIRVHGDGFVVRILADQAGVILTTDTMDAAAFEDTSLAITELLESAA